MRTSTIVFLVLFLAMFSSADRRGHIGHLFGEVKETLGELTDHRCSEHRSSDRSESSETRALRKQLSDVEKRSAIAKKSLRTIDRAVRALEERVRCVEKDMRKEPQFSDIYHANLTSLHGQIGQLEGERAEVEALREALKSAAVQLQSEIDLASIRDERREVEAFLDRERRSPVDRLAHGEW